MAAVRGKAGRPLTGRQTSRAKLLVNGCLGQGSMHRFSDGNDGIGGGQPGLASGRTRPSVTMTRRRAAAAILASGAAVASGCTGNNGEGRSAAMSQQSPLPEQLNPDGSLILPHGQPRRANGRTPATADSTAISKHLVRHLGPLRSILPDKTPNFVRLDIVTLDPLPHRPVRTFVTSGMRALPMRPLRKEDGPPYAELMIALPARLPADPSYDERLYWPVRMLEALARLPSDHNTWLEPGHTVTNGNPAQSYSTSVGFTAAVILAADDLPQAFSPVYLDGKEVSFFYAYPLYPEELEYKLTHGLDALLDRLATIGVGVTPPIKEGRPNSCAVTTI